MLSSHSKLLDSLFYLLWVGLLVISRYTIFGHQWKWKGIGLLKNYFVAQAQKGGVDECDWSDQFWLRTVRLMAVLAARCRSIRWDHHLVQLTPLLKSIHVEPRAATAKMSWIHCFISIVKSLYIRVCEIMYYDHFEACRSKVRGQLARIEQEGNLS